MRRFRRPGALRKNNLRGQSLVELALVLPLLLVLTGGIIQFGALIATKHTLIQIGRDVGRWAATQAADPCTSLATGNQPAIRADELAIESHLMGYAAGTWTSNLHSYGTAGIPTTPPTAPGVEVSWEPDAGGQCPPDDSTTSAYVTIRLAYDAPVVLPGFNFVLAQLPGLGTCSGSQCSLLISTTAQFRMEPLAEPAVTSP